MNAPLEEEVYSRPYVRNAVITYRINAKIKDAITVCLLINRNFPKKGKNPRNAIKNRNPWKKKTGTSCTPNLIKRYWDPHTMSIKKIRINAIRTFLRGGFSMQAGPLAGDKEKIRLLALNFLLLLLLLKFGILGFIEHVQEKRRPAKGIGFGFRQLCIFNSTEIHTLEEGNKAGFERFKVFNCLWGPPRFCDSDEARKC